LRHREKAAKICVYQEKCVSLQRKEKKDMNKNEKAKGLIAKLLAHKKAMRECIQNGADAQEMRKITSDYGFTLATPL